VTLDLSNKFIPNLSVESKMEFNLILSLDGKREENTSWWRNTWKTKHRIIILAVIMFTRH
jgi:hypothetical protein